jgi:hypothetical protein
MSFEGDGDTYRLNVGRAGFAGMQRTFALRKLSIHELTHVWQSAHSAWAPSFIFNSLWPQAIKGSGAYKYTANGVWEDYNVEQQASIVEDWFVRGQTLSDPNYPYIRDNIRTAKPRR